MHDVTNESDDTLRQEVRRLLVLSLDRVGIAEPDLLLELEAIALSGLRQEISPAAFAEAVLHAALARRSSRPVSQARAAGSST